ncbi:MAG: hypothetical protein CO041_05945 [Candidatus Pacebacteria bacterium CG_4_9_14_0_2_um_filter_40_15]|nr:MAG: hypothetical protein CO041_05945 [Candidatus Pacebacteria bacterium CG_4_9_14_0_2_um_filter_40_15]
MAESLDQKDVFSYITSESNNWKTTPIPITNSKEWLMYEHIQRCKNVSNGWFHSGKNDGNRPYNDIVTPIINVAFRSEGFDVKDIVPYVNDAQNYYKSFLIKKYHPKWAREHELDTFIDEVVETSIIYDLVLIKDVNNVKPEVVDLTTISFCDQTDVLAGPICLRHQYTTAELISMKGKWDADMIDFAIREAVSEKKVSLANDQSAKTPGKYIEVFELRGNLPDSWLDNGKYGEYSDQMHIIAYYHDANGNKSGITLYKGKDKPLTEVFKALKIDQVRSRGRACGKSIVESLFEPLVWNNYAGIKIKELMDSAINVLITDSEELGNQNLKDLKQNTIIKQEKGASTQRLDGTLQNLQAFQGYQVTNQNLARELGSASDLALGNTPSSGTPLGTTEIVHVEGQGIHTYRQGKIATFFADVLYRDLILGYLVKEMNGGKKFSEELTYEELEEISDVIVSNQVEREIIKLVLDGKDVDDTTREELTKLKKEVFRKGGNRKFFEILKGELDNLPMDVYVNIKGKQKRFAEDADKMTNIFREIIANPQAFAQIPGLSIPFNEMIEASGLSPINFSRITVPKVEEAQPLPITA